MAIDGARKSVYETTDFGFDSALVEFSYFKAANETSVAQAGCYGYISHILG